MVSARRSSFSFLFLLVAERLSGLLFQAVSLGEFEAFHLNASNHVELLQFTDDTMLIGEVSWENLWSIKDFIIHFELVSGLRVNLSKSIVFGINLDIDLLQATASFLSCSFSLLPFVFLGIPIGINPRRKASWAPIVSKIRLRLAVWHSRFLYIGGRVVLLNSVLSNISIFFFSFYKAPKVV